MSDKSRRVRWAPSPPKRWPSSSAANGASTPSGGRPQLKPGRRIDYGLALPRPALPVLSPVAKNLLRQIGRAADDEAIHLDLEVGALAEAAQLLTGLAPNLAKKRSAAGLAMNIALYYPRDAARVPLDLNPLKPFLTGSEGLRLQGLQIEMSLEQGLPSGFVDLIVDGEALERLSLAFLDFNAPRALLMENYLFQCLRLRKHALQSLELIDFNQVMSSVVLNCLLKDGLNVERLALVMSQARAELNSDFKIADLIAGGLTTLRLRNITLQPENMQGLGLSLGARCKLRALTIVSCWLMGQSEELYCGLTSNQSLSTLAFLQNRVEAKNVPAHRLLRLLLDAPKLKCLHIDCFEDDDFYAALNHLRNERRELEVQLHATLAGQSPNAPWRSGWHPDLDKQAEQMNT